MSKQSPILSVCLATRNEELNIGRCLESVKDIADEIVIADEQSSDKTVEIAKKYGARLYSLPHNQNFHITKNKAISEATGSWILQLDADEVVSPELASEISSVIREKENLTNGYWLNRRNWFLTRFLKKGGQYPDPTMRLYKKGKGFLPAADVHEQAKVMGPVSHLKNDLLHYRDTSFSKYLEGFNRYSSFIANQLKEKGQSFTIFSALNFLFIKPVYTFSLIYFRHLGLVDGFPGFVFAVFSGLIHSVAFIKYWQHTYHPAS